MTNTLLSFSAFLTQALLMLHSFYLKHKSLFVSVEDIIWMVRCSSLGSGGRNVVVPATPVCAAQKIVLNFGLLELDVVRSVAACHRLMSSTV